MHYEELTLDEAIDLAAKQFENYSSDTRVNALAFANDLCVSKGADPVSCFQTIWVTRQAVHCMIGARLEYVNEDEPLLQRDHEFIGSMMANVWCGQIESGFFSPLLSALAVEVQHRRGD